MYVKSIHSRLQKLESKEREVVSHESYDILNSKLPLSTLVEIKNFDEAMKNEADLLNHYVRFLPDLTLKDTEYPYVLEELYKFDRRKRS